MGKAPPGRASARSPPRPPAPSGTEQARPASPRHSLARPRRLPQPSPAISPAPPPAVPRDGRSAAEQPPGAGWRRYPRDGAAGPRQRLPPQHPPSCPRAGPEGPETPARTDFIDAPPPVTCCPPVSRERRGAVRARRYGWGARPEECAAGGVRAAAAPPGKKVDTTLCKAVASPGHRSDAYSVRKRVPLQSSS